MIIKRGPSDNKLEIQRDLKVFIDHEISKKTLQQIGTELGLSRQRVHQIKNRAKRRLESGEYDIG